MQAVFHPFIFTASASPFSPFAACGAICQLSLIIWIKSGYSYLVVIHTSVSPLVIRLKICSFHDKKVKMAVCFLNARINNIIQAHR